MEPCPVATGPVTIPEIRHQRAVSNRPCARSGWLLRTTSDAARQQRLGGGNGAFPAKYMRKSASRLRRSRRAIDAGRAYDLASVDGQKVVRE